MPCCKKPDFPAARARLLACLLAVFAALVMPPQAQAQTQPPPQAETAAAPATTPAYFTNNHLRWTPEGYLLDADINVELNEHLRDALARGVPLYFLFKMRIEQPRWYWKNRQIALRAIQFRLVYHTITRNWRLSVGNIVRNFDSLDDAIHAMLHIRNWNVLPPDTLKPDSDYLLLLRFRHETGNLPALFQLNNLDNSNWQLDTKWVPQEFSTAGNLSPAEQGIDSPEEKPAPHNAPTSAPEGEAAP